MKFKYKKYGLDTLRPIIPIEVSYNGIEIPYEVLIDSGADTSIFDSNIADILGIYVVKGIRREVWGITGVPEYYYLHKVTIVINGLKYKTDVGFMKLRNQSFGIVGQKGFFDKFTVKFDLQEEEIEVKYKGRFRV